MFISYNVFSVATFRACRVFCVVNLCVVILGSMQAPENYAVNLQFVGDFGLYCEYNSCYHWVEVKYKSDIGLEGPR